MRALLLLVLCLATSCGYRLGDCSSLTHAYETITIPYACGDRDGLFTAALINEVATSGLWEYRQCGGALVLKGTLECLTHENIGFEYDTNDQGEQTKLIVPNEGRLYATFRFTIVEGHSGRILLGPSCVQTWVDYDFDPLSTTDAIAPFSLGQFAMIDEAQDVARLPLYRELSRKVVDFLACAW